MSAASFTWLDTPWGTAQLLPRRHRLSWATEEAADVQAQRRRCREAEAHWADGSEFPYVLRPGQSEQVTGGFAVELGYWVHVDSPGVAMAPRARGL